MINVFKLLLNCGFYYRFLSPIGGDVLIETTHQQQRHHPSDHQDPDEVHDSPPCS
jgi:hypothetical protein